MLWIQIASLAFAGWLIWNMSLAAAWSRLDAVWLISLAALYALFAWTASVAMTLGLYLLFQQWDQVDMGQALLGTSGTAIWFVPAAVLLSELSPAALIAALLLVVNATRLLHSQWRRMHPEWDSSVLPIALPTGLFAQYEFPAPLLVRELARGLAASICLQMGLVAVLLHRPLTAASFFVAASAILTTFALTAGIFQPRREPSLPRSVLGFLLTVLLAIALTTAGMTPRLVRRAHTPAEGRLPPPRAGVLASARAVLRAVFYGERPAGQPGAPEATPGTLADSSSGPARAARAASGGRPAFGRDLTPRSGENGIAADGFPGVILWPEIKPVPTLIAPILAHGNGLLPAAAANPLSIPFSGEYWMFRWPYARPPRNSFFQRGSPAALGFRTTDHAPMQMEAHHKLDQTIDLACCRKIQIAIWNSDRYPRTVSLELVLMNTELPGTRPQSLGRAWVLSAPDLQQDPVRAVPETLEYAVPAAPAVDAFNEFKIVFWRDRNRLDKSAKIALDRFLLVPRAN